MFTSEQIKHLSGPLDPANVKSRMQGGSSVAYIEAYHAENEANRIFGFDAWDRETEVALIGEPRVVNDKFRVAYRAKVRITVRTPGGGVVVREGCGFGSGIDKDVDQAHESALKEAESDAEKRALKTFGNPFGQALYDKERRNVSAPEPEPKLLSSDDLIAQQKIMYAAKDLNELKKVFQAAQKLTDDAHQLEIIVTTKDARKAELEKPAEQNPFDGARS